MEIKKLTSHIFRHWQISISSIFLLCTIISIWYRHNPQWIMLTPREKMRIECNNEIWKSLPTHQQKAWLENQRRFQRYPPPVKEFIRLMYHNWLSLSEEEQQKRKLAYQAFFRLSLEQRTKILHDALFISCVLWENTLPTSFTLLREWNHFYKELSNLDPVELRTYIYYNFVVFHHLPFLPHNIQKNWQEATAMDRLKIIQKIQRKWDNQIFHTK